MSEAVDKIKAKMEVVQRQIPDALEALDAAREKSRNLLVERDMLWAALYAQLESEQA